MPKSRFYVFGDDCWWHLHDGSENTVYETVSWRCRSSTLKRFSGEFSGWFLPSCHLWNHHGPQHSSGLLIGIPSYRPSSPSTEVKVYLITCVCICHPKKKVYRSGRCIPLLDGNCMELRHLSIAAVWQAASKQSWDPKRENGHHVRSCWKLVNPILTKCADSCADIVLPWETVFCDTFSESLLLRN